MAGPALIKQGRDRRTAILKFTRTYIRKNGYGPSVAEIADGVGLASKTAVRHHLTTLQDEGKVEMTPGRYRSLRIVS
jgi:repressor LexA